MRAVRLHHKLLCFEVGFTLRTEVRCETDLRYHGMMTMLDFKWKSCRVRAKQGIYTNFYAKPRILRIFDRTLFVMCYYLIFPNINSLVRIWIEYKKFRIYAGLQVWLSVCSACINITAKLLSSKMTLILHTAHFGPVATYPIAKDLNFLPWKSRVNNYSA